MTVCKRDENMTEKDELSSSTYPDGAVFAVADDQLSLGVEDDGGDVVRVSRHGVHLPRLGLVHTPQLHLICHDRSGHHMTAQSIFE